MGEFEIEGLVAEGGFGIVYAAYDHSLDRRVALKEYMPSGLARRAEGLSVSIRSKRHLDTFQVGLRSFVNEARMLAQFEHPALAKVHRFWEANGTAYMVMPLYAGRTLKQVLAGRETRPDEAWLKRLARPLIDALGEMHSQQCYHRDVSPDNILVLEDGRPVLLDFGAARHAISGCTQALTVIVKPGYAPIEQYAEDSSFEQGPWTDVYGLAAVLHFAVTGRPPVPAVTRVVKDSLPRLAETAKGRYSPRFLAAIDTALAVRPVDRTPDLEAFGRALGLDQHEPTDGRGSMVPVRCGRDLLPGRRWMVGAGILAAAAIIATATAMSRTGNAPPTANTAVTANSPATFDPLQALDAVFQQRDRDFVVDISVEQTQVRIGLDPVVLSLRAARPGYAYLLMVGTDRSNFYLLFPNAIDRDNRVERDTTLTLPRPSWRMVAEGPAGTNHFVAIVSETPRDFGTAGLQGSESFAELPLDLGRRRSATHTGGRALFAGTPACAVGVPCPDRYGAAEFSIEEVDPQGGARK